MSTIDKASPRPWRINELDDAAVLDAIGGEILDAFLSPGVPWAERAEANAALIVRAVNAHDDLVAALEEALRQLEGYELDATGEQYNNPQINAALAKAKGVQS